MILRCLSALLLYLAPISGLAAQTPDELVLEGENIITVTIAGQPVRLEHGRGCRAAAAIALTSPRPGSDRESAGARR